MTRKQIHGYLELMRLDKPVGIYLLLWPTLWALLLAADGIPKFEMLLIFVLGVILTRSAGCVINDYADRRVDGAVARTASRPLVRGAVTAKQALLLFALLMLCAFGLVLQLNLATIVWSFVALFLATLYPFMKRYTHLPQVFLGAAFGIAIPMAFAAIQGSVPTLAWWLYGANMCWIVAYDTAYAMVDRDDDLKVGIKSTAILFGRYDRLCIGLLQGGFLFGLAFLGLQQDFTIIYFSSLLGAGLSFIYQHRLLCNKQREGYFNAFKNNNWTGIFITVGLCLEVSNFNFLSS